MCFSEKASLVAFVAGMSGSLLCFLRRSPKHAIVGLFFAFVTLMQLIDYLLWRHKTCDEYNKTVSKIGMILNHLQPLVLALLIAWYLPNANKTAIIAISLVYLTFIVPYSLKYLQNPECSIKGQNGWAWSGMNGSSTTYTMFIACMVALSSFIDPLIGPFVSFFTLLLSMLLYSKQSGAVWCFFVVAIPSWYGMFY